ncbi:MAG: type II toxin-antitoxin system RelE/ParE family toxin [Ignavibacteria bacterium CG_4_9_14_3_um_filter_36_18]|nr:type II toxin-antitoxin system RelE/ParE family toxin [Ignavibacteria bacterium]PJB00743.1 MAG: type II toxin-antitoxin system RelE/ParE family toxin [Ignavibacteria bacterium CG_4_9_14_3_um_filter_36_18]
MFEIVVTGKAEKDFKKLDPNTGMQIAKKLKEYSTNPFLHAKKLTDATLGTYRFRIGNYRVIADIEENKIIVLRVGHRKDIYN